MRKSVGKKEKTSSIDKDGQRKICGGNRKENRKIKPKGYRVFILHNYG